MKQLLLSNKNKEIKEYTLVSKEDYAHLEKFKWYKDVYGYIKSRIDNKTWVLHRYIMIELLEYKNLTRKDFIDHINTNKLDNRRENLRILNAKDNNRNKTKRKNTSSKYLGVIKRKTNFEVAIVLNDENKTKKNAFYKIEDHAAWQYNLWIKEYSITTAKLNNIEKPENFFEYTKKEKLNNLPKYIYLSKAGTYRIVYKNIICNCYKTLEEAQKKLNELQKIIIPKIIIPKIIIRNENNDCIIELFNKKQEKIGETIVDENIYNDLIKYKWCMSNGYVCGTVNKILVSLHRYIMNYTGEDIVDHINNNTLDNRKCNLRIITPAQNAMNKKSSRNSTSKYIGVSWCKNRKKWQSYITINNKSIQLGRFNNEIEAAKIRDIATLKYYCEYGNLNFPIIF